MRWKTNTIIIVMISIITDFHCPNIEYEDYM